MTYVVRRRLIARAGSSDFEIIILTTEVVSVLHFNLSLNDTLIEQVHDHRHLGVITDDEFSFQKTFICCHSSDTLWTVLTASCFTILMFSLT